MTPLDWIVLVASIGLMVGYGVYKSRRDQTIQGYMLADRSMPWWAMGLSIMATQATAITFVGTTGQAYMDGMRFLQFYLGLPLAMVILCFTVVPYFHRAKVVTAYEFLEQRFDAKTRVAASIIFLIQRGLGVGLALYAPAVVLSIILGWSEQITVLISAAVAIAYTVPGGIKAVTWTDVQQMILIVGGIAGAFVTALLLLPPEVSVSDAFFLAGALGKMNAIDFSFDWQNRYNFWSGLIGGMFLALAYFGCDQSQVQRYLTGKSVTHSRMSLILNAFLKLPLQFFILLTGVMVFVCFLFIQPPMLFNRVEAHRLAETSAANPTVAAEYQAAVRNYEDAVARRRRVAEQLVESRRAGTEAPAASSPRQLMAAHQAVETARREGIDLVQRTNEGRPYDDTNYVFLTFVTSYFPPGLIGLIIAAILAASAISAELNSLATSSVVDLYKRHWKPDAPERHYVSAAKVATVFWGFYAGVFALFGGRLGSLIEAVNMVGSLFYGSLLGVFVLAFGFPRVAGNAAFIGLIVGEIAIILTSRLTNISYLWYNVVGCVVVVLAGLLVSLAAGGRTKPAIPGGRA
jgi:SSS family transporter